MLIQTINSNSSLLSLTGSGASAPAITSMPQGSVSSQAVQESKSVLPAGQSQSLGGAQMNAATQLKDAPQLKEAIDKLNQAMRETDTNLEFSIDPDSKKTLIRVVDKQTGETIKQFPSAEVIAISKAIDRFQQGLLLRHKIG